MDTTAFQVAKGISQNLGQGYQKFEDEQSEKMDMASMGEILREAQASGDPQALDNAMSQMLSRVKKPENRKLGAGILQKRAEGIQKSLKTQNELQNKQREDQYLISKGIDPNIPKELRTKEFDRINKAEDLKRQQEADVKAGFSEDFALMSPEGRTAFVADAKLEAKNINENQASQGALDVVGRMKELRKGGHLGWKIRQGLGFGFANPNVRRDRAEYEQLGKSLISFATNIPIRNRLEFETLAENLYDPTINDDSAAGMLDSMQRIISNSLSGDQASSTQNTQPTASFSDEEIDAMLLGK